MFLGTLMDVSHFNGTRTKRRVANRCTTVFDAVNTAITSKNVVSIVVLPPAAGDCAADSDTEEVPSDMSNDTPFETAGEFEVEVEDNEQADATEVAGATLNSSATAGTAPTAKKRKKAESKQWKKKSDFDRQIDFIAKSSVSTAYPLLVGKSPIDIWRLIFDDRIINSLVEQTNLYAHRDKNCPDFSIVAADLLKFFGIILLSGYNTLPAECHYWSNQPDLGVPIVSEAMNSKQFFTIKRFFHIANNEHLVEGNKAAKVLPLYDALNDNLVQFSIWHSNLSIDESMVPYYGRHSIKMFIKAKPIRFGYKIWCMCGADGYPYHMKIYTGKEQKSDKPLCAHVVNHMVQVIGQHSHVQHHQLFFDKFFTSYDLLNSLSARNLRAAGTIRKKSNCRCQL